MNPDENNKPAAEEEKADENSIILTTENAPVIFDDTAEADEDDIELIDLTEDEDE